MMSAAVYEQVEMQLPRHATHPALVLAFHSCRLPTGRKLATDWWPGQDACKGAHPVASRLNFRQPICDHRVDRVKLRVEFALNAQQPDRTGLTRQRHSVRLESYGRSTPISVFLKAMLQSLRGF